MAIYSRFGDVATIVRLAEIGDIKRYEHREPDIDDANNLLNGCYVIIKFGDGKERLCAVAFLRADNAFTEIATAIEDAKAFTALKACADQLTVTQRVTVEATILRHQSYDIYDAVGKLIELGFVAPYEHHVVQPPRVIRPTQPAIDMLEAYNPTMCEVGTHSQRRWQHQVTKGRTLLGYWDWAREEANREAQAKNTTPAKES